MQSRQTRCRQLSSAGVDDSTTRSTQRGHSIYFLPSTSVAEQFMVGIAVVAADEGADPSLRPTSLLLVLVVELLESIEICLTWLAHRGN